MSLLGKHPLKILQPAFGRAGSTSLAEACQILGFGPVWHTVNNSNTLNEKGIKYWIKHKIDKKICDGSIQASDLDQWLSYIQCNCVMDAPIAYCYDTFFKFYPNAKVIITTRSFDSMRKSQRKFFKYVLYKWWFEWIICNISTTAYYIRFKFLPLAFEKHGWTKQEFMECDDVTFDNHHNLTLTRIKSMIPKDQLLIMDINKDGWKELCNFLNVEIPNQPFPHKNKTTSVETLNFIINAFVTIFVVVIAYIFAYIFTSFS